MVPLLSKPKEGENYQSIHIYQLCSAVWVTVGARNPQHVVSASVSYDTAMLSVLIKIFCVELLASDVAVGAIIVLIGVDASSETIGSP